jgi:hypothetical protein
VAEGIRHDQDDQETAEPESDPAEIRLISGTSMQTVESLVVNHSFDVHAAADMRALGHEVPPLHCLLG